MLPLVLPYPHSPGEIVPELVTQEFVEGASDASGRNDGQQFRDGRLRLATRSTEAVVRTVRLSSRPPLFAANTISIPLTDYPEVHYVTPTRVGIAVSRCDSVSYHSQNGVIEWRFRHDSWEGSGACAETPDGRHLLAIVPAPLDDAGTYPGDCCVLLESETGKLIDQKVLPSFSASYTLDAPFPQASSFFLNARQGQDDAYSWIVNIRNNSLHLAELASGTELVTGAQANRVLVQDVGGGWLQVRVRDAAPDGTMRIASEMNFETETKSDSTSGEVDERELFLMCPEFVDKSHIIVAVGEEWYPEETDHFLLDAEDLTVRFRIQYLGPVHGGQDRMSIV